VRRGNLWRRVEMDNELRTVTTKEELEAAKNDGVIRIIVVGKLAEDIKKCEKLTNYALAGGVGATALLALVATAPATGGLSLLAAAPVAAVTGLEISLIIPAVSIGVMVLYALYKDYDVVYEEDPRKIIFTKKR
jgi:hypothetical protein